MNTQLCSKCNKEFPLDNFYSRSNGKIYLVCKCCILLRQRQYYKQNRQIILKYQKSVYDPVSSAKYHREYRKTHKKEYNIWRETHKSKRNALRQERRKNDPQFKISNNLRCRIYDALKNNNKVGSAIRDLGCSVDFLKTYLESKFYPHPDTKEEMSWNNYSHKGWHIDHIKPLEDFDLTDLEQFKQACHYTNLQPLWAKDNYLKQRKIL